MSRLPTTLVVAALLASSASAQDIDYDAGSYDYPRASDPVLDDDVVTEQEAATAPQGVTAERVIMERRNGAAPQFVSRPVVQSSGPASGKPAPAGPVGTAPNVMPSNGAAPVLFAYPVRQAGGAVAGTRPGSDPALVAASPYEMPQGYVMATAPLPAGAQLVAFDRAAWLGACRDRLATYQPEERSAALAALGGAAMGYRAGYDACETYLDSYLANASTGGAVQETTAPGTAYMLVPVTIAVPSAEAAAD